VPIALEGIVDDLRIVLHLHINDPLKFSNPDPC
jgi:hypothetical protein